MPNRLRAYKLRHGDALMVSVWRDEALRMEVRVLPDGSITFPLAGRVEVVGLSTPEVEARVAEKLKKYIPVPVVTVAITATDGNQVYVLGKVVRPGAVTLISPETTVLQMLSQVGGLDRFADGNSIRVLRNSPQGKPDPAGAVRRLDQRQSARHQCGAHARRYHSGALIMNSRFSALVAARLPVFCVAAGDGAKHADCSHGSRAGQQSRPCC